jgi:hypothetical protein
LVDKERAGSARFSVVVRHLPLSGEDEERASSSNHQHVENDHWRQAQDHRPDAERPKDVLGAKAPWFGKWAVLSIRSHDAPLFCFCGDFDTRRILKSRSRFRSHLTTGATVD